MIRSLLIGVVFMLTASTLSAAEAPIAARPTPRVFVVTIDKMAFGPMPDALRAGDVVEWVNRDLFQHTATARDGSFDLELEPGAKARIVVRRGTFSVYCQLHPSMTASLRVK